MAETPRPGLSLVVPPHWAQNLTEQILGFRGVRYPDFALSKSGWACGGTVENFRWPRNPDHRNTVDRFARPAISPLGIENFQDVTFQFLVQQLDEDFMRRKKAQDFSRPVV